MQHVWNGAHRVLGRSVWLALGVALVVSGACGDLVVTEGENEATNTVTSPLAPAPVVFSDGSGQIQIQIRTCEWTPFSTASLCAYCAVDPGWVRIGGGAEIDASPSSAQLRASYPTESAVPPGGACTGNGSGPSRSAWLARSNGLNTSSHRLRAYVVGMKITGISDTELINQNYISVNETTSTRSAQPTKDTPAFYSNHVVVAGGAELLADIGTEPNGFLTESSPIEPTDMNLGWRANGSFAPSSDGFIKVYSIGIDPCMPVPGWSYCLAWRWRTAATSRVSGFRTVSAATPYPWVTAGIGARGVLAGASSRYLADLIPMVGAGQGFTVSTKEQGTAVSGISKGYAFNFVMGGDGLWSVNSIRFNTAGTAFSRPAGTAPVTLQQSIDDPDASPRRWHLEPMAGGRYRVRNGNPQQGTECAYRVAGSLDVRVTACGTSNDFLWTTVGAIEDGPFKLRNVGGGRCIDNNGQGATTSNLVFRPCVTGYSDTQSLFLDRFSWPP